MDAFLDCYDLCPDNCILASKDVEAEPRSRWNAIIVLVSDDLEQRCHCASDTLLRSSAASASPCGQVPEAGGPNNARSDMPQCRPGRPAGSRRTPTASLG